MERPPISIVVISYYKLHRLKVCLQSILPLITLDRDELCIVDNSFASWDNSSNERDKIRDYMEELAKIYPIKLIMNQSNRRFSEAVNQGIEATTNPFIFLVNNDIKIINMGTFDILSTEIAKRPKAATMTPVTIQSGGSVYCSGAHGTGAHHQDILTDIRQAEWNNFSFVCIKRSVVGEIGLLAINKVQCNGRQVNCRHFHSDEEWCRRATVAGYKHFVHQIQVAHYHKEDARV